MYTTCVKKVIKPQEKEECVYFSDVSGKAFGELSPDVEIKINFNYGSKFDGSVLEFHVTDEEILQLLSYIKPLLTNEYKNQARSQLKRFESDYDLNIQTRDWTSCEYYSDSIELLNFLLDIKSNE